MLPVKDVEIDVNIIFVTIFGVKILVYKLI